MSLAPLFVFVFGILFLGNIFILDRLVGLGVIISKILITLKL
jgi:hypothetical protein